VKTERSLKFSVYLAKRYGALTARFGILENTGGFGLKVNLLNDDLVLSADTFEFANPLKAYPRVKLYADYRFLGHLMLTAGVDDLVNTPLTAPDQPSRVYSGRDYFIGGGFYFTEDDFKLIFSATSLFK
jgi:phospholipid/cholesterol/gamma-HCH transport system substrate-binding protein